MSSSSKKYASEIKQILDYADANPGISYYEIEAYSYNNDLDDWIATLRYSYSRSIIANILNAEMSGNCYDKSRMLAKAESEEAKKNYQLRHGLTPYAF